MRIIPKVIVISAAICIVFLLQDAFLHTSGGRWSKLPDAVRAKQDVQKWLNTASITPKSTSSFALAFSFGCILLAASRQRLIKRSLIAARQEDKFVPGTLFANSLKVYEAGESYTAKAERMARQAKEAFVKAEADAKAAALRAEAATSRYEASRKVPASKVTEKRSVEVRQFGFLVKPETKQAYESYSVKAERIAREAKEAFVRAEADAKAAIARKFEAARKVFAPKLAEGIAEDVESYFAKAERMTKEAKEAFVRAEADAKAATSRAEAARKAFAPKLAASRSEDFESYPARAERIAREAKEAFVRAVADTQAGRAEASESYSARAARMAREVKESFVRAEADAKEAFARAEADSKASAGRDSKWEPVQFGSFSADARAKAEAAAEANRLIESTFGRFIKPTSKAASAKASAKLEAVPA